MKTKHFAFLAVGFLSMVLASCDNAKAISRPTEYDTTFHQVQLSDGSHDLVTNKNKVGKVLVVPVEFTDYPASALPGGADRQLEYINKAFFGTPEQTSWQSLKSFYQTSSFGNLNFMGINKSSDKAPIDTKIPGLNAAQYEAYEYEVMPWFNCGKSTYELMESWRDEYQRGTTGTPTFSILRSIHERYTNSYQSGKWAKNWDLDEDGFIDCIWMVYSCPMQLHPTVKPTGVTNNDYDEVFWAFTHEDYYQSANPSNPVQKKYVWASYKFMEEEGKYVDGVRSEWSEEEKANGTMLPDAHTYIHETGHVLGLPDYYDYGNEWSPAGKNIMMDNNVGDHDAYSKAMLGWINPYIVQGSGEVTIKSSSENGDAIAVFPHGEYHNTLCDEYIMIEYYRPDSMNKQDSERPYAGRYPLMPSQPGIRVYHVDSRFGVVSYNKTKEAYTFSRYATSLATTGEGTKYQIIASNSASRTVEGADSSFKQLHVLESSGKNTLKPAKGKGIFTNDMLFNAEAGRNSFNTNGVFEEYTLNSGLKLGISFEIVSMNNEEATIKFVKL